jgi:hypothetical protein
MRIRALLFARRKLHLTADIASVDKNLIIASTGTGACSSTVSSSTSKHLRGSEMIPRTKQFQVTGFQQFTVVAAFQIPHHPLLHHYHHHHHRRRRRRQ